MSPAVRPWIDTVPCLLTVHKRILSDGTRNVDKLSIVGRPFEDAATSSLLVDVGSVGNPVAEVNLEDVNVTVLTNGSDWACAYADVSTKGVISPPLPPECMTH